MYDNPSTCNKCGGSNILIIKDTIESIVTEYSTTCKECGFKDYWATGFFESGLSGYSNCEKY